MTVTDSISTLRDMGYKIKLGEGDAVKLSWQGQGRPEKDTVQPLIEQLKTHKREMISYLSSQAPDSVPFETLEAVFQEALDRVNDRCVEDPSLLDRYDAEGDTKASNHLNQVWEACLEGKATLRDFREAVAAWERAVLSGSVRF